VLRRKTGKSKTKTAFHRFKSSISISQLCDIAKKVPPLRRNSIAFSARRGWRIAEKPMTYRRKADLK
jgi:hypothetical protein